MVALALLFIVVAAAVGSALGQSAYPKVPVALYYEALCPGCQQFITTTLTKTLSQPDIAAITALKMVPYGNTKKDANGVFTCQHGVDECTSDVYEQCVLYKLSGNITSISTGDTSMQAFPFLQCMELNEGAPSAAQPCFQKTLATTQTAVTWATIDTCSQNEANAVQNEAAIATPAHDYVPWVLVDNKVLDNSNLLTRAICNAYTGPQPASCKVVTTVNEGVRSRSYNDN